MNFYRLGMYENPTVDMLASMSRVEYAHFSALGTWVYTREPCPTCDFHWQAYAPPLLVQWEPSTTTIGDFSWDGPFGSLFVVRSRVAEALAALELPCEFRAVSVVKPDRKRNVVPFPYSGPALLWGHCTYAVNLDMEASGVTVQRYCEDCGDVRYSAPQGDIVIPHDEWNGARMFTIRQCGGDHQTFVSAKGRYMLEEAGFTNVAFTKAGLIAT